MRDCGCKDKMVKCVEGWHVWFDDGSEYDSRTSSWEELPRTRLLIRILYHCDRTRQIQTADWFYEAPHPKGTIYATCSDEERPRLGKEHPKGVFKRGFWTVDKWFNELRKKSWDFDWWQ